MSSWRSRLWRRVLPAAELLGAPRVGQREHRLGVADLARTCPAAPCPRRAAWASPACAAPGSSSSSCAQLVQQRVVGVVADLRVVEDVVAVVVMRDLARGAPPRALPAALTSRLTPASGGRRRAASLKIRSRSHSRSRVEPVAVGQVEVDGRDRDPPARDRGEIGARLVLEARARSRRSGSGGGPSPSSSTSRSLSL